MWSLQVNLDPDVYHYGFYIAVIILIISLLHLRRKQIQNFPKGPYSIPLIGSVGFFRQYKKKRHYHIEEVRKKYGNIFSVRAGSHLVVFLNGYDVIREAFVKQADVFSDRPNWLATLQQGLAYGKGIVWQDANKSPALRKFAMKSLRDFGMGKRSLEYRVLEEVDAISNVFRDHAYRPLVLKPWLHKAVINVIHQIVFGVRFDYEDEKSNNLVYLIAEMFKGGLLVPRNFLPKLICRMLPQDENEYKRKQEAIGTLKDYVFNYIADHEETFDPENIRDFIDIYLEACEKKSEETTIITKGEIFRSILDIFLAGAETTAVVLVWCFLYMIKYPDIQQRCFEEIHQATGDNPTVTMNYKGRLPFTEATLLEVQRLATVAPVGVAHSTSRDTKLMGYNIPKDAIIISNLMSCAMDPEVWENPEMFEPERFLDAQGKLKQNEKHIPFSIGPRMCLGDTLAKTELFLIFANLTKKFRFVKSGNTNLDTLGGVGEGQVIFSADKFDVGVIQRTW